MNLYAMLYYLYSPKLHSIYILLNTICNNLLCVAVNLYRERWSVYQSFMFNLILFLMCAYCLYTFCFKYNLKRAEATAVAAINIRINLRPKIKL